jgi:pimeloyl-ACP methyl ester carboxylesterase
VSSQSECDDVSTFHKVQKYSPEPSALISVPPGWTIAKARATKRLPMPVLAVGGSDGVGDALRATVATLGDRIKGGPIGEGCGHFLPEECPDEFTAEILAFWRTQP